MRPLLLTLTCLILLSCTTIKPSPPADIETVPPHDEQTTSIAEAEFLLPPDDPTANLDRGNPELGREYFHGENRGRCLVCHSLHGEGEPTGWALDDTGLRRDPEWLAIFLHSPRTLRSEVVRMPPYRGDPEATIADVVAFLMTLRTPVDHPEPTDVKPPDEPEKWEGRVG